ncbi:MAG: CvpA family protein [Clostridia bacterium]|nr:CvpA family protein [Lachnospiraceae bacterium]NCB99318.1 CvpA family protein [Clostridia bacterium]NCD01579.1 CvpA family protein [Clostridia bacterium]
MDITNMNIVLIIAAVILLAAIIIGGIRGFIKTFFAAFSVMIAIFLAVQLGPYLGKVLQVTPIYTSIEGSIEDKLDARAEEQSQKVSQQIEEINTYPLPDSLKQALVENNNNQIYEALGVNQFNQYVAAYMACLIINALAFLIVLILSVIILKIIAASLDLISKLPILNGMNRLGGIAFGAVHGFIILWVLCIVVTIFSWTGPGEWVSAQISSNIYLSWLYNNNYLLSTLTNMGKMLF